MEGNRFDLLLDGYLSGTATVAEAAVLEKLLTADPALRRQFADRCLLEVHLHKSFAGMAPALPPAKKAKRSRAVRWFGAGLAAAAIVLLVFGLSLIFSGKRDTPTTNVVVAGEVKLDGVTVREIPEEKWFEVSADAPAIIRLADGSEAEIAATSRALLHGRREQVRASVEFSAGAGKFKVQRGAGQFRVETAAGSVTVLGTEFSVALETRGKGESKRTGRGKPSLTVAVVEGSVKVESAGKTYVLAAGERRSFPERTKKEEREDDD